MLSKEQIDALIPGYELEGNPDECIFMIHGFTGSAPELYPLATLLQKEGGYSIIVHALPGHGTSSLKALKKASPRQWMESVKEGYEKAKAKYKKVYVFGYSMGGSLAVTILQNHMPDALILCEAALEPNTNLGWVAKLCKYLPIKISWGDGDPLTFPDHSELYWRGQSGYYIKSAADLLTVAKRAKKVTPTVICPLFLSWADQDTSIRKSGVDFVYKNAPAKHKIYKVYPNNTHHLPSEPEKEQLAKDITAFLKENISVK